MHSSEFKMVYALIDLEDVWTEGAVEVSPFKSYVRGELYLNKGDSSNVSWKFTVTSAGEIEIVCQAKSLILHLTSDEHRVVGREIYMRYCGLRDLQAGLDPEDSSMDAFVQKEGKMVRPEIVPPGGRNERL